MARIVAMAAACAALAGCGASGDTLPATSGIPRRLLLESRPIGHGPRFHPGVTGPVVGACRSPLGRRYGVHVELFAANRVVLIAGGIGVRGPVRMSAGRIASGGCYGDVVTVEPTGVVLVRAGRHVALASLFRSWGQPLAAERLASFSGRVRGFVNGRRQLGDPRAIPLRSHAEIVLEVGPYVPPHSTYRFPPGA